MAKPIRPLDRPCPGCGGTPPETIFKPDGHNYRSSLCVECTKRTQRDRYHAMEPEVKKKALERSRLYTVSRRAKIRLEIMMYYSNDENRCQCPGGCDVTEDEFLSIDHINGGGNKHLAELRKNHTNLYEWLWKNDLPDGFRVLCMNCNHALGHRGYCPHEKRVTLP